MHINPAIMKINVVITIIGTAFGMSGRPSLEIDVSTPIILADRFTVSMPGGSVLGPNNYSLVGVSVENFFKNVNADIAFLASTGVFNSNGLTVSYPSHLDVKKNMVKCATKKIALLDSSKFVGRGIFNFCSFEELDTIITVGTESNARELKRIADLGVEIILV